MKTKSFRPLLATDADESAIQFPVYASPKIDGRRCVILGGKALSRSLKPIQNRYTRAQLEKASAVLEGFDGELTVGDNFNSSTSAIAAYEGEPDFRFHVFDIIKDSLPFQKRFERLQYLTRKDGPAPHFVNRLTQSLIHDLGSLQDYYEECLLAGHEGIIVRSLNGRYKYGRSTVKEGIMLKMKPFADSEAVIVGFLEQYHNDNPKEVSELGLSKRSSKAEGKRPANTLGKFVVQGLEEDHYKGVEFNIGTGQGLTLPLRKKIWSNKKKYLGLVVKFKYQKHGSIDKPRIPVFLGFRDSRDRS